MLLTFVHDGPLLLGEDGNYYEFAYHNLLERYKNLADEICFLIRVDKISSKNKFTKVPKEIAVISVPNFKSIRSLKKNRGRAERIIESQIKKSDIVVLRTQSTIAQIAEKYVRKLNKPYIIECVGCSWDAYWNHSLVGKIVAPYMEYKTKSAVARASYVYYVTNEYLQKIYPSPNAKTISCSNVVIDFTNENNLKHRLERISGIKSRKEVIIGTAASIDTKYKGQQYVIRAIKGLKEKGYKIIYHLAGGRNSSFSGENHLAIEAKELGLTENVIFCGSLSKTEMNRFYDDIDIYIQPSKQEGLPRSVIEAMSHGCPVLGSDLAGIPELIDSECLFKKGNVDSIADKIEWFISADLSKYARRNFEKSKEYEYSHLEAKRGAFYREFLLDNKLLKE